MAPEIMPFGRMRGLSVEQICLNDYKYFDYIIREIVIKKLSLRQRFDFVHFVANHFVSVEPCKRCSEPAKYIRIYTSREWRAGDSGFIYCSRSCCDADETVNPKYAFYPLTFDTTLSTTKFDTNRLVKVIADCMGLAKGRRSKEYLEDFFDNCRTSAQYRR